MATNAKPVYQRILLKLSGEALQGAEGFGIDASVLDRMAQEVKELVELGFRSVWSLAVVTYSAVPV
ncbi:uridylate kinase [Yersinia frederiksenii]|nr:uridylate kinase [Yersinia frederiksenii]